MFMDGLKETLNSSVTENGAVGYATTGKKLLDLNFSVTSMRSWSESDIQDAFSQAYHENKLLAIKWLFFARDVRGGIGERRLFRACLKWLVDKDPELTIRLIPLIPFYGRWDDLWCLLHTDAEQEVIDYIKDRLYADSKIMTIDKPISLLAKWMPSINTSSKETRDLAKHISKKLGLSYKEYRKTLSKFRSYLEVVEVKMSAGEWSDIQYPIVPSRANLIYGNAFLKHDEERRRLYLEQLERGETKINAGVLFPHDIVHKYYQTRKHDTTLEELWKALPDYVNGAGNTICVSDGSGSMSTCVGNTNTTALDVAQALAIYFAERSTGQFKNNYITFSENPRLVNFDHCSTLLEKLSHSRKFCEVANTNIEAVFDLILQTACNKHMSQEELPQNILILSDMEFDSCASTNEASRASNPWFTPRVRPTKKLFQVFAEKYEKHGYKLPRLVFWNICSRTNTIPVKENDLGVALVSGFSPAIVKMVLSNSTDPFECLLEQLNNERYQEVEDAVLGLD